MSCVDTEQIVVITATDDDKSNVAVSTSKGRKKASDGSTSSSKGSSKVGRKKVSSGDESCNSKKSRAKKSAESTSSAALTDDDAGKRHVKNPVERIDNILEKLEVGGVTKEVVSQLLRLRKQLDGAKIKQAHAPRTPNEYNIWMKNKMAELKDSDMPPKERFSYCIKLWNEEKASKASPPITAESAT